MEKIKKILPVLLPFFIAAHFVKSQDILENETCDSSDSDTCTPGIQAIDDIQNEHQAQDTDFDEQWNKIKNTNSPLKKLYIDCVDNHEKCNLWTDLGQCNDNPYYMSVNCRKSCGECVEYE